MKRITSRVADHPLRTHSQIAVEVLGDECATFGDQLLRVELECVAQGLLIFKGSMDTNNSRRSFLKGSAIAGAAFIIGSPAIVGPPRASVIVVGAGAFGGRLLKKSPI